MSGFEIENGICYLSKELLMVLNDVGLCYGVCKILRQCKGDGLSLFGVCRQWFNWHAAFTLCASVVGTFLHACKERP